MRVLMFLCWNATSYQPVSAILYVPAVCYAKLMMHLQISVCSDAQRFEKTKLWNDGYLSESSAELRSQFDFLLNFFGSRLVSTLSRSKIQTMSLRLKQTETERSHTVYITITQGDCGSCIGLEKSPTYYKKPDFYYNKWSNCYQSERQQQAEV